MKYALIAGLITFAAAPSHGAFVEDVDANLAAKNPEAAVRAVAQRILRENGQDYHRDAVNILKEKGEYFDIGRVEVTGFMSKDNTDRTDPSLADRQIKPSFSASEYAGPGAGAWKLLKRPFDPGKVGENVLDASLDYNEVKAAMRGEVTKKAKEKLAAYKGKEINEIIAHSWGSELVYAAILSGDLLPPKKLIVVGVPDDDRSKWETLAAMTGTEVHWARSENDKVAQKGAKIATETVAEYGVSFNWRWREACRDRPETCPAHNRQTRGVIWERIEKNPGTAGHDRTAYYEMLKKADIIKGTRDELRAAQDAKVAAETRRVEKSALDDALVEARGLVALAREQREIARRDHEEREANANKGRLWENVDLEEFNRRMAELRTRFPAAVAARAATPTPLSHIFPKLKEFSESACRAPERLPNHLIFFNSYDLSYRDYDDEQARLLSSRMSSCPQQLFNTIIANIRSNRGLLEVDGVWARATVAGYLRAPANTTGDALPSSGGREPSSTEATPPPPVVHDPGGEALDQLILEEEIARRKRWGLRPVR